MTDEQEETPTPRETPTTTPPAEPKTRFDEIEDALKVIAGGVTAKTDEFERRIAGLEAHLRPKGYSGP